ncbi:hypothetical protein MMC13_001860 [Lambiella insularis]|nr:hypothetical protein [Lambiella insularis]
MTHQSAQTPDGPSQSEPFHTNEAEKDPFLTLLEQLTENEYSGGGPGGLDYYLGKSDSRSKLNWNYRYEELEIRILAVKFYSSALEACRLSKVPLFLIDMLVYHGTRACPLEQVLSVL